MIARILDFRLRQLGRLFKAIGAVYLILLVLVCFGFFMGLVESMVRSTSAWTGLLGVMIASSVHFSRKDGGFLQKLEVNKPKLYALEYLFMTLPLALAFAGGQNFRAILVQSLGILIIAFLPNPEIEGKTFSNAMDYKWLPKEAFEIRSYLRRFFIPTVVFYVVGLIASKFITVTIAMVLVMALLFTSFFDELENKALLEAIHFKKNILTAKVQTYLGLYFMILLPYIGSFLLFNLEYWYILLAALFVGSTLIIFNIFYKYANFSPNRRRVYNSMANSIFFVSVIIPFFYPVTLLYLIYYGIKARKNIRLFYAENK